jgi:hypothetical protein
MSSADNFVVPFGETSKNDSSSDELNDEITPKHTIGVNKSVLNTKNLSSSPESSNELRFKLSGFLVSTQADLKNLATFANRRDNFDETFEMIGEWWKGGYLKAFLLWICWMVSGTVFYSVRGSLGWAEGFYMMVNVGYSIGWGYPVEKDYKVLWYSVCNVLVGATALSFALQVFANSIVKSSKIWYHQTMLEESIKDRNISFYVRWYEWALVERKKLTIIFAFWVWIFTMVIWSQFAFPEWVFIDGLYFAISSLSTGGMWRIPTDTATGPDYVIGKFEYMRKL